MREYKNDKLEMEQSRAWIPLNVASELAEGLLPGDYQIVLDGKVWTSLPVSFRVEAGATTRVRIPIHKR